MPMMPACDAPNVCFDLDQTGGLQPVDHLPDGGQSIVNSSQGWGMDALVKIVNEHVPRDHSNSPKMIRMTDRREDPKNPVSLVAVVRVGEFGGYYTVSITGHRRGLSSNRRMSAEADGYSFQVFDAGHHEVVSGAVPGQI